MQKAMKGERVGNLQKMLLQYRTGGGAYKDVEKGTGISRTAISQLANHGVILPRISW